MERAEAVDRQSVTGAFGGSLVSDWPAITMALRVTVARFLTVFEVFGSLIAVCRSAGRDHSSVTAYQPDPGKRYAAGRCLIAAFGRHSKSAEHRDNAETDQANGEKTLRQHLLPHLQHRAWQDSRRQDSPWRPRSCLHTR